MKYLQIIKKMKKLFKNILNFFIILVLFSACQTTKDVLTGKKKTNNSDQFLIEKKNPLILPPEFNSLPKPETLNKDDSAQNEDDIKSIFNQNKNVKKPDIKSQNDSSSLENSILKKIKKN
tara:strand:- start:70 stop:429 length:360 start_codon:yes stop_codon:yes gene_type:complete